MSEVIADPRAWLGATAFAVFAAGSVASAQPSRPPIADPVHAYLVEGRVVDDADRALAAVVVERVRGPADPRPFSRGAYRETTDARGRFRFAFRGLGFGTGRTWHLAVHRAGCAPAIQTVQLREGEHDGAPADVATNVVLRVPRCRAR